MLFVRGVEGLLPELAAPWTDFFMKSAYYFNTWARFNTICSSMFLWLLLCLFRPSQCQGMSPDFISVRLCLFVCPSVQGDECGHRGVGYLQLLLLSHYLSASIATWPFPCTACSRCTCRHLVRPHLATHPTSSFSWTASSFLAPFLVLFAPLAQLLQLVLTAGTTDAAAYKLPLAVAPVAAALSPCPAPRCP